MMIDSIMTIVIVFPVNLSLLLNLDLNLEHKAHFNQLESRIKEKESEMALTQPAALIALQCR